MGKDRGKGEGSTGGLLLSGDLLLLPTPHPCHQSSNFLPNLCHQCLNNFKPKEDRCYTKINDATIFIDSEKRVFSSCIGEKAQCLTVKN